MKIGILTMFYEANYGGVLQSYALYKTLMKMGHDVLVIDYRNSGKRSFINIVSKAFPLLFRFIQTITNKKTLPMAPLNSKNKEKYDLFKKEYINYSVAVDENSIEQLSTTFDAIAVGSDQIWNDVNHSRLTFYLDWSYKGKKIAFSACTILESPPFLLRSKIRRLLDDFDYISVRDQHTADYVESSMGKRPLVTCDPTCLYDFQEFVASPPISEPYILVYILGRDISGGGKRVIDAIKEKNGSMKVVALLVSGGSATASFFADVVITDASPKEWVNYFSHASFIYTDSFHGVMFSLKFRKAFICYVFEQNRQSRLIDVQKTYGLSNIVFDAKEAEMSISKGNADPDYSRIQQIESDVVSQSLLYLTTALSDR